MKSVAMYTPPHNVKLTINDKSNVKCIKVDDKTWVNISDFTDMSPQEILPFLKNNKEISDMCLEFNYWGTIDYYVESDEGLSLLIKKINEKKIWL